MTTGVIVWLAVAAVSAVLFFGIAAVVSVRGVKDLQKLLRDAGPTGKEREGP